MGYCEWHEAFARRHRKIVQSLGELSREEIVDAFEYERMKEREPDFCPLYAREEKCHEMEGLNCYFCGCPYFRFHDRGIDRIDGKIRYSLCAIDARDGKIFETEEAIHQDCSDCQLPHRRSFILRHFKRDWSRVMEENEWSEENNI